MSGISLRSLEVDPGPGDSLETLSGFPEGPGDSGVASRTATKRSKKGSEKVLGRVLGKGSQKRSEEGPFSLGFTVKRVLRRVLRRGSEKGVSRRRLELPLGEYDPSGVRPT